jgi:hypothetical protein
MVQWDDGTKVLWAYLLAKPAIFILITSFNIFI